MPKFIGKSLRAELRKLASEISDQVDEAGDPLTNDQVLARMIWRQAKGWTEVIRDDNGNKKEIVHPPVAWAQQFIYLQVDGKVPEASPDDTQGIRAVDKVSELAAERLNNITGKVIKPPPPVPTRK